MEEVAIACDECPLHPADDEQREPHAVDAHHAEKDEGTCDVDDRRKRLAGQEVADVLEFPHAGNGIARARSVPMNCVALTAAACFS